MAPVLPPLATAADMTAYGYDPVSAGVLARASARVRRYTGQQITPGSSTTVLTGIGPWRMPQRPVDAITAVLDSLGNPAAYELQGQILQSPACAPLTVTYTHGFDPLPDGLVELVCAIAARLGGTPKAVGAGARTEQAGGETVTWGVEAYTSASGLTKAEESGLDTFYPPLPRTVRLI